MIKMVDEKKVTEIRNKTEVNCIHLRYKKGV